MPVAGHVGSDYERLRPDFKVLANPYEPAQRVMVVPAIRCDVALLHAMAASPEGLLLLDHMEDDVLLAQASRVVIASAERIAGADEIRGAGEGTVLEAIHVTAVLELPGGVHPTRVRGCYDLDAAHLTEYVAAAAGAKTFHEYLSRYVYGPNDHAGYLDLCRRGALAAPPAPDGRP